MGRHAFVTGANRGIGLGIAERLVESGFTVTAATRSAALPASLAADVTPVTCDITDV